MSYSYTQLFRDYLYSQEFSGPLKEPLEYILFNEGHYIRPQLTLAWCEYCGGNPEDALPLALAIEYIHTASLIHDDLPSMDNATERRGKPCLHIAYDEATAILTGDALINMAYTTIINTNFSPSQKNLALSIISGVNDSLFRGQRMEFEKLNKNLSKDEDLAETLEIHKYKTADLIRGACFMGIVPTERSQFREEADTFGHNLGMLYQLFDDKADDDGIMTLINKKEFIQFQQSYLFECNKCLSAPQCTNSGYLYLQELLQLF